MFFFSKLNLAMHGKRERYWERMLSRIFFIFYCTLKLTSFHSDDNVSSSYLSNQIIFLIDLLIVTGSDIGKECFQEYFSYFIVLSS